MREIKFRAWNKEMKVMCYNNEDNSKEYFDGIRMTEIGFINDRLSVPDKDNSWSYRARYEVMQYTGLKDKNGREIYEGDIVKIESHTVGLIDGLRKSEKPKVKYRRIGWHPNGSWNSYRTLSDEHVGIVSVYKPEKWCEVVGNIYENGDLLEGESNE